MKKIKKHQKCYRILSVILALILSVIEFMPLSILAENTSFINGLSILGASINLDKNYANGAKCTYIDDNSESWHRVSYNSNAMFISEGVHIEISEITCQTPYTFLISMGNDYNMWTDKPGYMLAYDSQGYLKIFPTKTTNAVINSMGKSIVIDNRETLNDVLIIDIKLVGTDYCITINEKTYSIPATYLNGDENTTIKNANELLFSFGMAYGFDNVTEEVDLTKKILQGTSFVISDISYNFGPIKPESIQFNKNKLSLTVGESQIVDNPVYPATATGVVWSSSNENVVSVNSGTINALSNGNARITATSIYDDSIFSSFDVDVFGAVEIGTPNGFRFIGDENSLCSHQTLSDSYNRIILSDSMNGCYRIIKNKAYNPLTEDISLELNNVKSSIASDNYSFAFSFGNSYNQWFDSNGYLMLYSKKSGKLVFLKTLNGVNSVMSYPISVFECRETFGNGIRINIHAIDDVFIVTVNGKEYRLRDSNVDEFSSIYVSFGIMSDFDLNSDNSKVCNLNYTSSLNVGNVSFDLITDKEFNDVKKNKLVLPFAKYNPLICGYDDGSFRPEEYLTREEAICSLYNLFVDNKTVNNRFTCDYKDVGEENKNYDCIAYMKSCGFLDIFSDYLYPDKAITRKEFFELLLDAVSSSRVFADINESDAIYNKASYAVNRGMIVTDDSGNFNSDLPIKRWEAAKALCVYTEKSKFNYDSNIAFTDVKQTDPYFNYVILACSDIPVYEENYIAEDYDGIMTAIEKAKELSELREGIVNIKLSSPVYKITESITIDGSSFGEYPVMIYIKPTENNNPVISSNIDINASCFSKVDNKEYYTYQLPLSSKKGGEWPQFRDLYLNDERLTLARSDVYSFENDWENINFDADGTTVNNIDNGLTVAAEAFDGVTKQNIGCTEICTLIEWTSKRWRIADFNKNGDEISISLNSEDFNNYLKSDGNIKSIIGERYWFENNIAFLDEPGEFWYDCENGIIYVYPFDSNSFDSQTISYPTLDKLIYMTEMSNISLQNLKFTGATSNYATYYGFAGALGGVYAGTSLAHENIHDAAIFSDYSNNISIIDCDFSQLGTNGIFMLGGNINTIINNNSFCDIAMSAITFGRNFQDWDFRHSQTNIFINNNFIYDIGTDYRCSPAIHIPRVKNCLITNNTIIHTPYSGLMLGWVDNYGKTNVYNAEVAYNHIEDNLYALNDGSAMYFAGDNALVSDASVINRIHSNYIKANGYTGTYTGTYLDMSASNYKVYKNVYSGFGNNSYGPVFNQDHISTQYTYNNTICDNYTTMKAITTSAKKERNIVISNNRVYDNESDFPQEAKNIIIGAGCKNENLMFNSNNCIVLNVKNSKIEVTASLPEKILEFSITNNTSSTKMYSVKNDDESNGYIIYSDSNFSLNPGESGVLTVSFRALNESLLAKTIDITVLRSDGWKKTFARAVILASKSNDYPYYNIGDSFAYEKSLYGTKITYFTNSQWFNRCCTTKTFDSTKGIHMELSKLNIPNVENGYSFAICFGNSIQQWTDKPGYMLVYSSDGTFEVFATPTENLLPCVDSQARLIFEKREPLSEGFKFDIKLESNNYIITVNSKSYSICATYDLDESKRIMSPNNLRFAFSVLPGTDENGNVKFNDDISANTSFTIKDFDYSYGVWNGTSNTEFKGAGTEDKPYLIEDACQLYGLASLGYEETFGRYYKIINDIEINKVYEGWDKATNLHPWISKVANKGNAFAGNIDGNNKVITGLYLKSTDSLKNVFGLFPVITSGAVICNLNINGVYAQSFSENEYFGAVVGWADTFNNNEKSIFWPQIVATTVFHGNMNGLNVGGIAGYSSNAKVSACSYCGTASNGIIGLIGRKSSIENCCTSCEIISSNSASLFASKNVSNSEWNKLNSQVWKTQNDLPVLSIGGDIVVINNTNNIATSLTSIIISLLEPSRLYVTDLNGDGCFNLCDLVHLKKYAAGVI